MATEATYSAGSIFAMGSADVLLYAVWSQLYTLSYNANGATFGSAPGSVTAIAGAQTIDAGAAKLFKVTSTVSYRISSWNTQSGGGGTLYHSGATLGLTQNTILYAQWTALAVGDIGPSGGKIFLDAGNYTAGYRYMEVAPSDSATNFVWASRSGVTNATGTAVGTGKNNTQVIYNVASWNSGNWAVLQVIGLYFGLSDWFLPSTGELTALFNNLNNLGGPTELQQIGMYGWEYWSSTEVDMLNADYVYFGGSAQTLPMGKGYTCNVRAIREF